MYGNRVLTISVDGAVRTVAEFDDNPSGLGFLPDGTPILVLRNGREIVRLAPGGERPFLNLADTGAVSLNDMVVDETGRGFVGCIMRADRGETQSDQVISFDASGSPKVAASGLAAPNGMVLSADGGTLIVAATWRQQLLAMTAGADGVLAGRRVHAVLADATPDGICLDAEGGTWVGGLASGRFIRVMPNGDITDEIDVRDQWAIACVLGGPDRKTLFMTVSQTGWPVDENTRGCVVAAEVDVAGAGWP